VFNLAHGVVPAMVAQGRGRIISIAARPALHGPAGLGVYAASKAAVLRLTESLSAELLEHGITVNAVLPSIIDTPQNRQAMPDAPFDRWVAPESLAGVTRFLASDAARDITGAAIPVYGKS
jgi:NAD(P)-dependent dehydrogenase (short-subunit alcohol dehydrogenase family)